jgi:hypothetical protein
MKSNHHSIDFNKKSCKIFPLNVVISHDSQLVEKHSLNHIQTNSAVWVRERTIPAERMPLVGEVSAKFCG